VTPNDSSIEQVLSLAKEYHPKKVLQEYPGVQDVNLVKAEVDQQCESLFYGLKEWSISYVNSVLSFGWNKPFKSQRIRFPSTSINTKSANCIDGTVLFASLLETIGINPVIILLPGHAIVGWRGTPDSLEISLLETTVISDNTYSEAKRIEGISLNNGITRVSKIMNRPVELEGAIKSGHIRFIDVQKMRENGIFPSRDS
jgi:hypothetical protein